MSGKKKRRAARKRDAMPQGAAAPPKSSQRTLSSRLRGYFLTGLVAVVPVAITIYLAIWSAELVDSIPEWIFPDGTGIDEYWAQAAPGVGIIAVLVTVTFIGWLTSNFFGRWLLRISERVLQRLPIVSTIHKMVKQISDSLLSDGPKFDRAVLVQYPMAGTWVIAYVAAATDGEIAAKVGGKGMVNVYVPTTPNPTSGFLLFVPTSEVIDLDMSIEESATLIISAGLITPSWNKDGKQAVAKLAAPQTATASAHGKPKSTK